MWDSALGRSRSSNLQKAMPNTMSNCGALPLPNEGSKKVGWNWNPAWALCIWSKTEELTAPKQISLPSVSVRPRRAPFIFVSKGCIGYCWPPNTKANLTSWSHGKVYICFPDMFLSSAPLIFLYTASIMDLNMSCQQTSYVKCCTTYEGNWGKVNPVSKLSRTDKYKIRSNINLEWMVITRQSICYLRP